MLQANDHKRLTLRSESSFREPPLAASRRGRSRSASFPEAVIACLVEGRPPSPREIAAVAARICKECRRLDGPSWQDLPRESRLYRSMIAAARAALGARGGLGAKGPAIDGSAIPTKRNRAPDA
jgi:hypothetical protein